MKPIKRKYKPTIVCDKCHKSIGKIKPSYKKVGEIEYRYWRCRHCSTVYIKYLRDRNPESQEAVDLNEERAKLTKTKRLNEELDLAVKKGELHRSEDIEKVMTAMLINFKSRLSAIPAEEADKLAAMTGKAKIFLYLNDKIKEALNELSDFEGMFKEEIKEDEEGND